MPFTAGREWEQYISGDFAPTDALPWETTVDRIGIFLTRGTWCGYYTGGTVGSRSVDPPMKNIQFTQLARSLDSPQGAKFQADGCSDGIANFTLTCEVIWEDNVGGVRLRFEKAYPSLPQAPWVWDCRLTPFGIHGFWGQPTVRMGAVWLWKSAWTAEPS